MRQILIGAALMVIAGVAPTAAQAQDLTNQERQDRAALALDFTQCAGMFWAWSDIATEMGYHPDDVEMAAGYARGASLVASLLAATTMSDPRQAEPFVDEQVESNRITWRSKLRAGGAPDLTERLARCQQINAMQADLITRLRQNELTR